MILLKDACISTSKKDDIINKEIQKGIMYFPYADKKIFNFLNLKNQYLTSGTFSIDDLHIIDDNEKTSRLLAFKVNSRVLSTLCVFLLDDEFKQNGFNNFKKSLLALKDMPLNTKDEIENKIESIFSKIVKAKPLYITIDFNDDSNEGNKDFIISKVESLTDYIDYIFLLEKQIIQTVNIEKQVEENIEQEIQDFAFKTRTDIPVVDPSIVQESLSFEKEFENFYSIDTAKEHKDQPKKSVKVTNTKVMNPKEVGKFTILLIKNINLYYVFTMVFAFFVGLGAFASVYLLRTDYVPVGVVLIILFVLFMFVNTYIYASTYAGVKKHLNTNYKKFLYVLTFLIATIAGLALSYGGIVLMDSLKTFIVLKDFVFNDYLFAIISLPILLILCCLSAPLARLYVVWHKFKIKYITKSKKE